MISLPCCGFPESGCCLEAMTVERQPPRSLFAFNWSELRGDEAVTSCLRNRNYHWRPRYGTASVLGADLDGMIQATSLLRERLASTTYFTSYQQYRT